MITRTYASDDDKDQSNHLQIRFICASTSLNSFAYGTFASVLCNSSVCKNDVPRIFFARLAHPLCLLRTVDQTPSTCIEHRSVYSVHARRQSRIPLFRQRDRKVRSTIIRRIPPGGETKTSAALALHGATLRHLYEEELEETRP